MNQARRQTRRRSAAHRMGVRCVFCCNNGKEVTGLITMNDAREFIRATSPWVAMGLLVAILMIQGAASTKMQRMKPPRTTEWTECLWKCASDC